MRNNIITVNELEILDFFKTSEKDLIIKGKAGTGKTTLISNFLKYNQNFLRSKNIRKIAVATLSHKAKGVISSKIQNVNNITFLTIAGLLDVVMDLETGEFTKEGSRDVISNYDLIIIDECSMISEKVYNLIQKKKKKSSKIIYIGDFNQLPPIGESCSILEKVNIKNVIELTKIQRQNKDSKILELADKFISKDKVYLDRVDNEDVFYYNNFEKVLEDYKNDIELCLKKSDNFKFICYKNETKNLINVKVRELIFNKNSLIPYLPNDVIILNNNYQNLCNSDELKIIDNKPCYEGNYLIYLLKVYRITDNYPYTIKVLNHISKELFDNDLKEYKSLYNKTKDVNYLRKYYDLKNYFADISYNYCVSVHKSQGSTYKKVCIVEKDIQNSYMDTVDKNKAMYVAVTRASDKVIVLN